MKPGFWIKSSRLKSWDLSLIDDLTSKYQAAPLVWNTGITVLEIFSELETKSMNYIVKIDVK